MKYSIHQSCIENHSSYKNHFPMIGYVCMPRKNTGNADHCWWVRQGQSPLASQRLQMQMDTKHLLNKIKPIVLISLYCKCSDTANYGTNCQDVYKHFKVQEVHIYLNWPPSGTVTNILYQVELQSTVNTHFNIAHKLEYQITNSTTIQPNNKSDFLSLQLLPPLYLSCY